MKRLGDVEDAADVDAIQAIEIGAVGLQDRADVPTPAQLTRMSVRPAIAEHVRGVRHAAASS
jgi:hypothetical protein